MKDKLNARQRKFAEDYAQSGNAAESAVKAGYSAKYANTNASKLLQNTTIANYIKELSEKLKDERIMTARIDKCYFLILREMTKTNLTTA